MTAADSYDVIIIGTGAGGGTLAHRLAPSGKRILILERGDFLPREKQNWDSTEVFQKMRYHTEEKWFDAKGKGFMAPTGYFVGGNTKVYGGAMFRLRERDFETIQHKDGISPEWPVKYRDFEPFYTQAEALYEVHGKRGVDPTEPEMSAPTMGVAHQNGTCRFGEEPKTSVLNVCCVSSSASAFGITVVILIYCQWGRQSGAQFNPAVTLAMLWLNRIQPWDAFFYSHGDAETGLSERHIETFPRIFRGLSSVRLYCFGGAVFGH